MFSIGSFVFLPVLGGKHFHGGCWRRQYFGESDSTLPSTVFVLSRTWGICGKSCWASQYLGSLSVLAVSSSKVRVSTLFETPKNIESQSWNQAELELQVGTFQSWNSGKLELELLHGEKRVREIRACRFQLSGFHHTWISFFGFVARMRKCGQPRPHRPQVDLPGYHQNHRSSKAKARNYHRNDAVSQTHDSVRTAATANAGFSGDRPT